MATLSKLMKKAASPVIALANRTPHRNYTSAIFTIPLKISTTISTSTNLFREVSPIPTYHNFSALATQTPNSHDTLVSAIESEIDRAEEEFDHLEVVTIPGEFPFKIEDNAGEKLITLTREYQGEEIKVTVLKPDPEPYRDSDSDSDEWEDEKKKVEESVHLNVCVTKKSGTTLKFNVTGEPDWVTINTLAVNNPNASDEDNAYAPAFLNLDMLVRESFRVYLENRGVEPSSAKFLLDYMANKERKEYTAWLKHLKNFIAN
ncbi:hypothetical protein MKW94_017418 [Papaver nudicaule]|uniref:Mitochondrial glycoprotein n=1 Tax=Papaver nudicaule TaxID=74823 RepID=A0AA41VZR3_PAPNU|nr:hypothetical protein [Papaver nudicaule]